MTDLFKVILIETRNTCTRKCWFCKFGQERKDEAVVEMEWSVIERIVYNLQDLNYSGRISWYGTNEPLLEKRILKILQFTRSRCPQAFLSFITNGDLLDAGLYRSLRSSGLDALGVSIYDDKTFEKVKRIQDERLVMIEMRPMRPGRLENRAGNVKRNPQFFEVYQQRFENRSCGRPFSMMMLNPKGQVVLCCSDMYGDVIMGDVTEQRLEEIWNNDLFRHYRTTLAEHGRKTLKLCQSCSYSGNPAQAFFPLSSTPAGQQPARDGASPIQSGTAERG